MSAAVEPRHPTPTHVALALARFTLGDIVGDELPDWREWWRTGYVTFENMSGTPGLDLPTRNPIIRYSFWASTSTPGSTAPPWLQAEALAGRLQAALQAPVVRGTDRSVPNYLPFRIVTAYPTTDPARIRNDPGGFARVDMSVLVKWVEVPA